VRYWWVNQKQTHRQEIGGGYLWSPKRKANGDYNRFYENMKLVAPGDLVFCYWNGAVRAYGALWSFGYDAPKPEEFGNAGRHWSQVGYRADVDYVELDHPIRPGRDPALWPRVRALLPAKYAPLNAKNGNGLQSVYLALLPDALGALLFEAIADRPNTMLVRDHRRALIRSEEERERRMWERHLVQGLREMRLDATERDALIRARRGQGVFRRRVAAVEGACRVTRVSNPAYLIASHIKPWRHADNEERLSAENGLMLAPQADFLFDRGFITFGDGRVLVSPVADESALVKLGVDPDLPPTVGGFSDAQERFLEFHRAEIFRDAG